MFDPSAGVPITTWEKTWTESRMRWFADSLGIHHLLDARVILPTPVYFPVVYRRDADSARRLLDRLADYMGMGHEAIALEVLDVDRPAGPSACYDPETATLFVGAEHLGDAQELLALFARELSYALLLDRGILTEDVDHPQAVVELFPVFLGVGVFGANAAVYERSGQAGLMSWWVVGRQGHLPARILGYAHALFAFVRGEEELPWAAALRPDAAVPLREGLLYLRRTGDSLFHPDTIHSPRGRPTVMELAATVRVGTPSARLAALWELYEKGPAAADAVDAVIECLGDRDMCIPGEAARVLGVIGPAATPAVPLLLEALHAGQSETRAGAAEALGCLRPDLDIAIPELTALLQDSNLAVVQSAAQALAAFGKRAGASASRLLDVLRKALIECDETTTAIAAGALFATTSDLKQRLREHFGEDAELHRLAVQALREERDRIRADRAERENPSP